MTEVMHVDMSRTVEFRESNLSRWESSYGLRISLNDLVTKAVTVALQRHPLLNATLVDNQVRVHNGINIGLAVHLDQGLVVPVLKDAGSKNLEPTGPGKPVPGRQARGTELWIWPTSATGPSPSPTWAAPTSTCSPPSSIHPKWRFWESAGSSPGRWSSTAVWRSFPRPISAWSSIIGPSTDTRPASS